MLRETGFFCTSRDISFSELRGLSPTATRQNKTDVGPFSLAKVQFLFNASNNAYLFFLTYDGFTSKPPTDSIMEPTVHSTLGEFLKVGGSAIEVITSLSESYAGLAPMCDLVSTWGKELDMDGEAVMRGILRELLMEKFDPQSVDEEFMSGQVHAACLITSPDWLDQMIEDPFWRQVIYELSEKYQQCLLLNFAIQKISDAGHQGEIAKIAAAAVYINVFNGVLKDSLEHIREEDDVDVEESIPDFVVTNLLRESANLPLHASNAEAVVGRTRRVVVQACFQGTGEGRDDAASSVSIFFCGGLNSLRINQLYVHLPTLDFCCPDRPPLVSQLRMTIAQAPPNIAEAVNATLSSKNPTPGDVMTVRFVHTWFDDIHCNLIQARHTQDSYSVMLIFGNLTAPSSSTKPTLSHSRH
ncbi:TH1 protein-domain-containing protein [Jimgerdemannia flammicorona]|uniref:TH1 protein-domain-containing protein n=1 Tax=Jimgerdemannia flammicorona TaxID=994334 RepID=A0A433DA94_9FUNG|nr:TH1 protein-domain-containing protein [Jimgerdemannia flammicorona]